MSSYQNQHQPVTDTNQVFSSVGTNPGVTSMWVDGAQYPAGIQGGYVPAATQGHVAFQGQNVYHTGQGYNVYQQTPMISSPGYPSQINVNHVPQSFPSNFFPPNSLPGSNSVLIHSPHSPQSPQSLGSPMTPIDPMVTNHLFAQQFHQQIPLSPQNFTNPKDQLVNHGVPGGGQLATAGYVTSQNQGPLSPSHGNIQYQQQQLVQQLQQQQQQLLQQQQQRQQQQQQQQQLQPSSQVSSQNRTNSVTVNGQHVLPNNNQDTNSNSTEADVKNLDNTSSSQSQRGPYYVTSVQPAPPSTYLPDPIHPRQNTLPFSLPTSLNASLQLKTPGEQNQSLPSPANSVESPVSTQGGAVRSSWEAMKSDSQDDQTTSGRGSSISSSVSPPGSSPTSPQLSRTDLQWADYITPCYEKPAIKDLCLRCNKKVYLVERVGPIKEVVYHKNCFCCVNCGTKLNLKNFYHNPNDMDDLNVFCLSHKPKDKTMSCDATAVHIKTALNVPKLDKVNEQIRVDRYPSEVLARAGYVQPSASALKPTREDYYYGMEAAEKAKAERQLEEQRQQRELQEQQMMLQHQQQQQEQSLLQQQQQEQQMMLHRQKLEELQYQKLLQQQEELQQQLAENNSKLTNGTVTSNAPDPETGAQPASPSSPAAPTDDVFDTKDQSSSTRADVTENLADEVDAQLKIDDQNISQQRDGSSPYSGIQMITRSDRPSDQSSRSSSPVMMRMISRSTDGDGSRRSSTSSNYSNQDLFDLNSSTGSLTELRHTKSTSSMERADRPSSSSSQKDLRVEVLKKTAPANRMMVKSYSDNDFAKQRAGKDLSRVLPRNESMRMDRPSQYS